ncbi:MAG: threonine synthase [Rubrobacteraceae bacterium]
MGKIAFATVLDESGKLERFDDPEQALETGAVGQIELQYEFGPDLIPPETPSDDGMWRYRALLPIEEGKVLYPLAIGGTPLISPPRLSEVLDIPNLWLKDETRTPTGSNKDRATALVLEHAMRNGVGAVSCASTGNVAVSLAVGAAAAGIEATIFVPAEVSESKLKLMQLAGATVLRVEEGYEAAFELSREAARTFGWYDRNTGDNPLTLEAKKTVAFEIWEQLGRQVPDAIIIPVGDGPTLSAMVKGFRELRMCGVADRLPRIVGVQAEGCRPIKQAWDTGDPVRSVHPETIADGIAVGAPICAALVLRDVRESGGGFVEVSDDSMLQAIRTLAVTGGVLAEPAGAAALAGLEPALRAGLVKPDETVIVHVTGTGLKNIQYLQPEGTSTKINASLEEVQQAMGRAEKGESFAT